MSGARQAFVTGGTGFVGLNLVDTLVREGWAVTALHRASSDLTFLGRFQARRAVGAITDRASLLAAIPEGTDTLFHVAGNTNQWSGGNAAQTRDNVEGTANVVEAAIARGVRRLVVTSSVAAYGPIEGELREDMPSLAANAWINYQKTKYEAQEIARAATRRGLEVVILQPGAILGPYDIGTWSRLFTLIRDGKLPGVPPGGGTFTHVREVVRAHIAAADKGVSGDHYILGGTNASMMDLVVAMHRVMGKTPPTRATPAILLRLGGAIGGFVSTITGREPTLTPEMAFLLTKTTWATSEKAQRDLGYKLVDLETMVRDSYDWLVAEGRI